MRDVVWLACATFVLGSTPWIAGCGCTPNESHSCGICGLGTQTCTDTRGWGACIGDALPQVPCGPCNDGMSFCGGACAGGTQAFGASCGSCGGTVLCGGACSVATPPDWGQPCGSCGGLIDCSGSCSNNTPATAPCGSCGDGVSYCGGACQGGTSSYGQACGSCGGTIQCGGGCSNETPATASCGVCGDGVSYCGGACQGGTTNYGQPCGACGQGWIACGGGCVADPGPYCSPEMPTCDAYTVSTSAGHSDWATPCHSCSGVGPQEIFATHWYDGPTPANVNTWNITASIGIGNSAGGCFEGSDMSVYVHCYDTLPGCQPPWNPVALEAFYQYENVAGAGPKVVGPVGLPPGHTLCCDFLKTDYEWTGCAQPCCHKDIVVSWTAMTAPQCW